jgi:hypothetical protein
MSREVGIDQTWRGRSPQRESEGLEYHQRTSHGQGCVEVCYPCARTMSWLRDHMGFTSTYPTCLGLKALLLLYAWLGLFAFTSKCKRIVIWTDWYGCFWRVATKRSTLQEVRTVFFCTKRFTVESEPNRISLHVGVFLALWGHQKQKK